MKNNNINNKTVCKICGTDVSGGICKKCRYTSCSKSEHGYLNSDNLLKYDKKKKTYRYQIVALKEEDNENYPYAIYFAWDRKREKRVKIKEFSPRENVDRNIAYLGQPIRKDYIEEKRNIKYKKKFYDVVIFGLKKKMLYNALKKEKKSNNDKYIDLFYENNTVYYVLNYKYDEDYFQPDLRRTFYSYISKMVITICIIVIMIFGIIVFLKNYKERDYENYVAENNYNDNSLINDKSISENISEIYETGDSNYVESSIDTDKDHVDEPNTTGIDDENRDDIEDVNPQFYLESVNDQTGVKIIIDKIENANAYSICLTDVNNIYSGYYGVMDSSIFKTDYTEIVSIKDDDFDSEQCFYTFSGLPAGKYTFKIIARKSDSILESNEKDIEYDGVKTIEIREVKSKRKKMSYDFTDVVVGSVVEFGAYEQDGDFLNGPEKIEWYVLKKTKKSLVLLSKYALDFLPFDISENKSYYGKSTLRKWLNNDFFKRAFSKTERNMIIPKEIPAGEFSDGSHTEETISEKVTLLSMNDIDGKEYALSPDTQKPGKYVWELVCYPTKYAVINANIQDREISENKIVRWGIRTQCEKCFQYNSVYVNVVEKEEKRFYYSTNENHSYPDFPILIRPLISISLKTN